MNLCVEANLLAITVLGVNRVDENSMGWDEYINSASSNPIHGLGILGSVQHT